MLPQTLHHANPSHHPTSVIASNEDIHQDPEASMRRMAGFTVGERLEEWRW